LTLVAFAAVSGEIRLGLFLCAVILGISAWWLWDSVDHESVGVALGVVAATAGLAWFVTSPDEPAAKGSRAAFCEKHECVGNFDEGRGYRIKCADGVWSFSGGIQGSCSSHGGNGGGGGYDFGR
jgi:hypothetical protein